LTNVRDECQNVKQFSPRCLQSYRPKILLIPSDHINEKRHALRTDNHKVDYRMGCHCQSDFVSPLAEFACHGKLSRPMGIGKQLVEVTVARECCVLILCVAGSL